MLGGIHFAALASAANLIMSKSRDVLCRDLKDFSKTAPSQRVYMRHTAQPLSRTLHCVAGPFRPVLFAGSNWSLCPS